MTDRMDAQAEATQSCWCSHLEHAVPGGWCLMPGCGCQQFAPTMNADMSLRLWGDYDDALLALESASSGFIELRVREVEEARAAVEAAIRKEATIALDEANRKKDEWYKGYRAIREIALEKQSQADAWRTRAEAAEATLRELRREAQKWGKVARVEAVAIIERVLTAESNTNAI